MKQLKYIKKTIQVPVAALALIGFVSACGGSSTTFTPANSSSGSGGGSNGITIIGGGTGGSTGSTGTTGGSTGTMPPETFSFSTTGQGSQTINGIDTDNILRVRITSGSSGTVTGTGFSGNYGCIQYQITVLGQTVTTQTLSVNGGSNNCPGAPTSQIIDFSSRLTPGHGSVSITIKASGYDFYCQGCYNSPWLYQVYPWGSLMSCSLYCPLHPVYQTHVTNGTMDVQVNGTTL